jgi:mono/diheme cytochrome c family protein
MSRVVKYTAGAATIIVALAVVGVAGLYAWTNSELKVVRPLPEHGFTAPTDSAAIARGEHVVRAIAKCVDCHMQDLGGGTMVDDAAIGRITTPNLTTGRGGILAEYTDTELERAIRHGVARDGRRLMIMPAMDYQYLSDADVGALIAYLRTVAPVDREPATIKVGPVARALYAAGKMPWFPGDVVTHREESIPSVAMDSTVEYGKYLGDVGCAGCHGANYSGGQIHGAPPDWPQAANLTPGGIGHYSYADFVKALREGVRPDGSALNPVMPIPATKLMTDIEMVAMWKYLQSLPAQEYGVR